MSIGLRIRTTREAKGISQSDLARRVGVKSQAVSQWESDTTKSLRPQNLLAVADELDINIRWLITGRGTRENAGAADRTASYLVPNDSEFELGALTEDEANLVRAWRCWSPVIRKHVELLMIDTGLNIDPVTKQFADVSRRDQERFNQVIERKQKQLRSKKPSSNHRK